ncbi:MAG: leucine--tRNA ligase [Nitrospiraceae bacterium]|nr:MAG: leucine--tRNA ligase [Nitrospiraceae bacterium]
MLSRYEPDRFEAEWRRRWQEADLFRTVEEPSRPKFYALDFFPYPSGAGLSVGHLRNYIPTDVLARAKRMQGFNVLHPMGWDAFGLPAENEAIAKGRHPAPMVREYAATYKRQQNLVGISYDWSREINSSDPSYYKWTQYIFLILYKRGLAYRGEYAANWCPQCLTVLANEEVEGGLCWRCGTPVVKKALPQWFFKITDYADRLLDDLELIDWPEGIKMMQRNWIGRSVGAEFDWPVVAQEQSNGGVRSLAGDLKFRVFTTRIDTVFGATFCVLAPEHPLVEAITAPHRLAEVRAVRERAERASEQDRLAEGREKVGAFTGAYALNEFTGEQVPIFVADYVLMGYGTGAIMAVPAHDERDFEFAQKYGLEIRRVVGSAVGAEDALPYVASEGVMLAPEDWVGVPCEEAKERLYQILEGRGLGGRRVNYRLRDWLISRQRYWGAPIPIVHCEKCGMVPVPEEELPVLLPEVDRYQPTGTGESPLAAIPEFVNTNCPQCGGPARRETDTMGGFACSSWYFLRFCDPHNDREPFSKEKVEYWMPVDCYVGGAEHAVMHLLYARFWTKVLHDEGLVSFVEPFSVLRNQGMVLAPTPYRRPREGEVLRVGEEGILISREEAEELPPDQVFYKWEKMSKSKGNVVTPDEAVEKYGADALRVYELFEAPFEQAIQWSEERVQGAIRFLHRVFRVLAEIQPKYRPNWRDEIGAADSSADRDLRRATHAAIAKVREDIDRFAFNTAIAALMEFTNTLTEATAKGEVSEATLSEAAETLILLLSPFAPHSADEIWQAYGKEGFTLEQPFPEVEESCLEAESVTIVVQVNGKVRDSLVVKPGTAQSELESLALSSEKVKRALDGKQVVRVVVVPDKLLNVVAK